MMRLRGRTHFPGACITAAAVLLCLASPAAGAADNTAFRPGEKLHYTIYWIQLEAAEATLEILPMEKLGGQDAWHFVMTAKTSPLVENIFPVFDRMDSYAEKNFSHALLYKEHKQTRKLKDVSVLFDWKNKTVTYTKKGKQRKPQPLMAGAFDPLSIFYFFRLQPLQVDQEFTRPVSDGKKCVTGTARVRGREKITVAGKEYDAFLVEPDLTGIGGVFEKSPGARLQIWVTADERKIPVLIKSEVAVGSFTAELDGLRN